MSPAPLVIGRSSVPFAHKSVAMGLGLLLLGCSGDLAHRSVAEFSGTVALPPEIRTVRIEVQNGTVGIDVQDERSLSYAGGVRRAADSADALQRIEAVRLALTAERDPEDSTVLVVRGPRRPATVPGMLALELGGVRLPADLAVEITIAENGHVAARNRGAALFVSTGRGDLRFEMCEGAIKARTGRGNVIAYEHRGDIDIETAVGDMQVFVREPGERIRLDTGEGTVQCYIPPTSGFRLDSRAEIGRCGSSFGLPVEHPSRYSAAMIGARGDERTQIILRTGKGHLSLGSKTFE